MKACKQIFGLALLALVGCDPSSPEMKDASLLEFPDLQFSGKADGGSSNITMGPVLERGNARAGAVSGYVALPVSLEGGESLLVQAWTDKPSVVFVFGPQMGGKWDFEQVREFSHSMKPGVESQWFNYDATFSGDYLVIVGALSGELTDWIVAWADKE